MKLAAFTLKNIFYPEVYVRPDPDFNYSSQGEPTEPRIKISVVHEGAANLYQFMIQLSKDMVTDADAYELKALAVGVFTFSEEDPGKDQLTNLFRSAPNIVYGSLREHFASITARAPWNEYYLPIGILEPGDFELSNSEDSGTDSDHE